jgi:hypothetical protein
MFHSYQCFVSSTTTPIFTRKNSLLQQPRKTVYRLQFPLIFAAKIQTRTQSECSSNTRLDENKLQIVQSGLTIAGKLESEPRKKDYTSSHDLQGGNLQRDMT